ncbi:response regulator, partial [bacterium]|nr:response regulator [bacterium]
TILVVEDEEALRSIICKTLTNLGYTVLEAANGLQAISYAYDAVQNEIKLMITDVVMPEMSGRELVDQLKLKDVSLKVLYISGYTDDAIIRHGISAEEVDFLQKPFSSFTLVQKVRELLDRKS